MAQQEGEKKNCWRERFRALLWRLWDLPAAAIAGITLFAAVLLILVFWNDWEGTPLAYFAYLFSTYALVLVCGRGGSILIRYFWIWVDRVPFFGRLIHQVDFRVSITMGFSLLVNVVFAFLKMGLGIFQHSFWLIAVGIYYLAAALARFSLLRGMKNRVKGASLLSEYRQYRRTGVILLLMNLTLTGILFQMIWQNQSFDYPGVMIFAMAAFTFYMFYLAICNVFRFRRYGSPLLSASRVICLATAFVSMLSLESALIGRFDEGNMPGFRFQMMSLSGTAVCLTILLLSVYMVRKGSRKIEELKYVKLR